ncbi:MAG: hypothetical protein KJN71_03360 [Acidimicrobiia bacterium]|nr:hypothetical protein [Acidimicrobiia bacterium]NNC75872.1 hypothetical protein [Acidimicrobiia bacterium]
MAYILFFVLFGVLIAVGLAFAWQEARPPAHEAIFGMREAVGFIYRGMDPVLRQDLRPADIERIVGWELRYVDEQRRAGGDEPVVVASLAGGAYAQQKAIEEGFPYDGPVIEEVLRLEAEYLSSLGVVGEEVSGT